MPGGNNNHIRLYTVLRGGIAVHNPNNDPTQPGGSIGTLGCILTDNANNRWLLSCYHVLCRVDADMPPGLEEPIFHPFSQLNPNPIATISAATANRQIDCAAARILGGAVFGEILGIGRISDVPIPPALGMRVLKSGAETGVTEGRIVRIRQDEFEIAPLNLPDDFEITEGGDSGSLWIDADSHSPVGMHFKGNDRGTPECAFAKPLASVLAALNLSVFVS